MQSLADAIIDEDFSQVRALLGYGVNLNQLDEYGYTPLIEAAIADNISIVSLLLSYGADVNLQDSIGGTALHWAAENNNEALCKLLLVQGANPNLYTLAGQPPLVMPILRQHFQVKRLIQDAGGNLEFAQDYINTKFIGHLFELVGTANLIDPYNQFVEVDFEGFYLEVTLAMIVDSLRQFNAHFAGRQIRRFAGLTEIIIDVLDRAVQLIKYQQYRVNYKKHEDKINKLLEKEPLVIPVGYEGHAITFVKMGQILVKCDRREDSRHYDNVTFFNMNQPQFFTADLVKKLMYEKLSEEIIMEKLPALLALEPITELKIPAQISGNCSWANVEACIPVLYFLLFSNATDFNAQMARYKKLALDLFYQWREWNKERALHFCIHSFKKSDSIRKATKGEILAAILYQCCQEDTPKNREYIESILEVLGTHEYEYILQNYVRVYAFEDTSEEGKNFVRLLKSYGFQIK